MKGRLVRREELTAAEREAMHGLLTSGFRTYRFLPVFWRDFWPRWDAPTPPEVQARLDFLAGERLGDLYGKDQGIVRFPEPQRLRGELSEVPEGRLADPKMTGVRRGGHRDPRIPWVHLPRHVDFTEQRPAFLGIWLRMWRVRGSSAWAR